MTSLSLFYIFVINVVAVTIHFSCLISILNKFFLSQLLCLPFVPPIEVRKWEGVANVLFSFFLFYLFFFFFSLVGLVNWRI